MPTKTKDETVLPNSEEEQETETEEETTAPAEEETEETESEDSESENEKLKKENEKLKSDNENYKKGLKAAKEKNKAKELPTANKAEFVTTKEFHQESENKAKARAREEFPELAKDEHWDEIINDYFSPKVREGKTVEENTFLNLKNAATLWKADQKQVDNSEKTAAADAATSKTTPSKGDTSQPKKSDNTETEDYYLDKLVPNRK